MNAESLQAIELQTQRTPDAAVIILHGLGADGHDFVPFVRELEALGAPPARYIFPHAPTMPVTINGGHVMRAWYDIVANDLTRREDEKGVRASQKMVEALIADQVARGVDAARIVLAGFSQGGAITLQTGLRQKTPLAGLVALSSYLPLAATLAAEAAAESRGVPIFMAHGTSDPVIPHARAVASRDALVAAGYDVEWHEYPMPHSVSEAEIRDIARFLERVLA
jgi:phospholipase/carboxylesterase